MPTTDMTTAERLEPVGQLRVADEDGNVHEVTIRREDLTTTNAGFRAVRDEVVDTLERAFVANRGPRG